MGAGVIERREEKKITRRRLSWTTMEVTADDDDIKWSCVRWKAHRTREPPEFTPMGTKKKATIVGGVVGRHGYET